MTKIKLTAELEIRTFTLPPAEFDPLTATERELSVYGFPRRPEGKLAAHWESLLGRRPKMIAPEFAPRQRPAKEAQKSDKRTKLDDGSTHNTSSGIWAGGVVEPPPGEMIRWVEGVWNVPTSYPPVGFEGGSYYASSWVGIDGWGTNNVLQAGVDSHADTSDGKVVHSVSPWWEWYPAGSFWITNFPVASGDTISCVICVYNDTVTEGNVYLLNVTSNVAASFTVPAPKGISLQGTSAEWIIERLTDRMGSYGTVFFDSANAGTGDGKLFQAGSGFAVDMIDGNGTESETLLIGETLVRVEYTRPNP